MPYRLILFSLWFLLLIPVLSGQEDRQFPADSMMARLDGIPAYRKIRMLNAWSKEYWNISLEKSLEYAETALSISQETEDYEGMAISYNRIGNAYSILENYGPAVAYYDSAIIIQRAINLRSGLATTLGNQGICYYHLDQTDKSLEKFLEQLQIATALAQDSLLAVGYHNLGELNGYLGNYPDAFRFLDLAANNYGLTGQPGKKIEVMLLSGSFMVEAGDVEMAMDRYRQVREIGYRENLPDTVALAENLMGRIHLEKNEYPEALELFESSLSNARIPRSGERFSETYQSLSEFYVKTNNPEKAFFFGKLAYQLKDSVLRAKRDEKLERLQIHYDIASKNQELQFLRKNQEIETLEVEKDRIYRNFLIILVIILFLAAGGSSYIFFTLRKSNRILTSQMGLLEVTNAQLLESERNLMTINLTKSKFFTIIAHDLISPFRSLLESTHQLVNGAIEPDRNRMKRYSGIIYNSSRNLYQLLENLLQWARNQRGNIDFHPEYFDLSKTITHLLSVFEVSAHKKEVNIIRELQEAAIVYADENHVTIILRNLISNAIKYSNSGGDVIISSHASNGFFEICIKDQGTGIPREEQEKLFRIDSHFTTMGTANELGTGLGLIISKELVEKNGGIIRLNSEEGKGSSFFITLPRNPVNGRKITQDKKK